METNLQQVTSTDFMGRFCSNLDLPVTTQDCAVHVAKKAIEFDLVAGRSPVSVAAAVIFLTSQASPTKKTAKEVAEVAGATESTASELFPEDFKCTTPLHALPF
ncbi:unnamed protein product, partial [Mesorhabditis belari]|uniref:Transcription factor TFIIB cyclin-like domain-containing protein n=1 Tax=Mesorhabditis belari TaxID=2138241 RepID=A0AAF3FGM1_9BILA